MDLPVPFAFQNFELLRNDRLGLGSYGVVCKAKCDDLLCAAKILHPTLFDPNPDIHSVVEHRLPQSRFEQECVFLSSLKHPNIVQYLGTRRQTLDDVYADVSILLMELMDESLTHFLESSQEPIPFHIQVNFCHDIAVALSYLHSNGIVHRDMSSNNVLLIGNSRAKVTDFGMARFGNANNRSIRPSLTMCPGTEVYMPPETKVENGIREYSEKVDCFSFGVLDIQILTRTFPDPGNPLRELEIEGRRLFAPQSEVERRNNHIRLVDAGHPLLPIALNCLNDSEVDRPTASEICRHLEGLKLTPQYADSKRASNRNDERERARALEQQLLDQQQRHQQEIGSLDQKFKNREAELLDIIACRDNEILTMTENALIKEEEFKREIEKSRESSALKQDEERNLLKTKIMELQDMLSRSQSGGRTEFESSGMTQEKIISYDMDFSGPGKASAVVGSTSNCAAQHASGSQAGMDAYTYAEPPVNGQTHSYINNHPQSCLTNDYSYPEQSPSVSPHQAAYDRTHQEIPETFTNGNQLQDQTTSPESYQGDFVVPQTSADLYPYSSGNFQGANFYSTTKSGGATPQFTNYYSNPRNVYPLQDINGSKVSDQSLFYEGNITPVGDKAKDTTVVKDTTVAHLHDKETMYAHQNTDLCLDKHMTDVHIQQGVDHNMLKKTAKAGQIHVPYLNESKITPETCSYNQSTSDYPETTDHSILKAPTNTYQASDNYYSQRNTQSLGSSSDSQDSNCSPVMAKAASWDYNQSSEQLTRSDSFDDPAVDCTKSLPASLRKKTLVPRRGSWSASARGEETKQVVTRVPSTLSFDLKMEQDYETDKEDTPLQLHMSGELMSVTADLKSLADNTVVKAKVAASYEVSYVPVTRGRHVISIYVNEQEISSHPVFVQYSDNLMRGIPIQNFRNVCNPLRLTLSDDGKLYVTDMLNQEYRVIDAKSGAVELTVSCGQKAKGITIDPEGNVYVSSLHMLQKFDHQGQLIHSIGSSSSTGNGIGQFNVPNGIRYHNGKIYLCDGHNKRIQVFDRQLHYIGKFGTTNTPAKAPAKLQCPEDIDIDERGHIYVADRDKNCIVVFNMKWDFVRLIGSRNKAMPRGALNLPMSVRVFKDRVYVSDRNNNRIAIYNKTGNLKHNFVMREPMGMEIDKDGFIYVCDMNIQHCIYKF